MKAQGMLFILKNLCKLSLLAFTKENNKIRLCVNYKILYNIKFKNVYSIYRVDNIIDTIANFKVFLVMDAKIGYYQIGL